MKEYDLLIVGSGVAGLYAWKLAKLNDLSSIIIESNSTFGGQVCEYYPQKMINNLPFIEDTTAINVVTNMYNLAKKINKTDIFFNTSITKIEEIEDKSHLEKTFNVTLSDNNTYNFKKILLCNGLGKLEPIKLVEEELKNVIYSIKDFSEFKNKKVIVIGGGDSAVDFAIEIAKYSKDIKLIHRRDEFRASVAKVEKAISSGVDVIKDYLIIDRIIEDKQLKSITIQNNKDQAKKELSLDYIVVAYGMIIKKESTPNIKLTVDEDKKYVVNHDNQTSNKGIFAVGDCCVYPGKIKNIIASQAEANKAIINIEKNLRNKKVSKGW